MKRLSDILPWLYLVLVLTLVWFGFSPGSSGTLHFDDRPNLSTLTNADSPLEKLQFVLDGQAGPLGRPVALATFVLQQEHWPDNVTPFIQLNVLLHLATGLAVFLLALGLSCALDTGRRSRYWIAVLTTALWSLSPFLASTQLMIIQRMTTLAGLFVFAGLAAYVWGRILHAHRPCTGVSLMASGIILGTLLAAFSKENGALLPLLVLVIELTLLRRFLPVDSRTVRLLQWLLIGLPVLLLILYLVMRLPGLFSPDGHRDFTPMQRLATQPGILWEYVRHLLLPNSAGVTPFSDDRLAIDGWRDAAALLSTGAWFVVVALALALRRYAPVFTFAVLFFLAGHLLESSIIYLELYYAHRNYIPAFGLYFALAVGLAHASRHKLRLVILGSVSYVLTFAIVLVSTTSLWGQPLIAAEIWSRQHPESHRANQYLANAYFRIGDRETARRVLKSAAINDDSGILAAQALYTCNFEEPRQQTAADQATEVASVLRSGRRNYALGDTVLALALLVLEGRCDALRRDDVLMLADAVLTNPAYERSSATRIRMYNVKALMAESQGDIEAPINYTRLMYAETKHVNHARFHSGLLATEGRYDEAIEFLETARGDSPWNPVKHWLRNQLINEQIERIQRGRIETTDSL